MVKIDLQCETGMNEGNVLGLIGKSGEGVRGRKEICTHKRNRND
jgi:hypothetical protein